MTVGLQKQFSSKTFSGPVFSKSSFWCKISQIGHVYKRTLPVIPKGSTKNEKSEQEGGPLWNFKGTGKGG